MATNKRVSINEKIKKPSLLDCTETVEAIDVPAQTGKIAVALKRQTYYIEPDMIKAIGLKSVLEGRDKSDIVRAALEQYLEKKYFEIN